MSNVTLAELVAQAEASPEKRQEVIEMLRSEIQDKDAPPRSITEFFGVVPWDGQDIDEKIRRMRDED